MVVLDQSAAASATAGFCYTFYMQQIIVESPINEPVENVWEAYTNPTHIKKWNHASPDWTCPRAETDLREGGVFTFRMESKDGSEGFDFTGAYTVVVPHEKIAYTMGDGRKAVIEFIPIGNSTHLKISFDAENENPIEMQKQGWYAILTNFKEYVENTSV